MARQKRIDLVDHFYHVMARGIEQRAIFLDTKDYLAFMKRLGPVSTDTNTAIFSFALMPNHVHILIRRADIPLSRFMQRLLTSYAIHFNRRHHRVGHLFQNRYKSIVCEGEQQFLTLVRYINQNPYKAGLISSPQELDKYPFCSHAYILGSRNLTWFDTRRVLCFFGKEVERAKIDYREFVETVVDDTVFSQQSCLGERSTSLHAWNREAANRSRSRNSDPEFGFEKVCQEVAKSFCLTSEQLLGASRQRRVTAARARLAWELSLKYGQSNSEIASRLGVTKVAVMKMLERIQAH